MFAFLLHDPALLKLLIYKLCMTTHSLANSALWLLSDWEDFQEKVVVTFYSVLLGIWEHQTTERELACTLFTVRKGMQCIWTALLLFFSCAFYFLSLSFYFFVFEIFLLRPVYAFLM